MPKRDWLRPPLEPDPDNPRPFEPKSEQLNPSTRSRWPARRIVFWVLVALFAVFLFARYSGHDPFPGKLSNARMSWLGVGVTAWNDGADPWMNVRLEIQPGGYTCQVERIDPGSFYQGLAWFANANRTRFNPITNRCSQFTIRVFSSPWPQQTGGQQVANFTL